MITPSATPERHARLQRFAAAVSLTIILTALLVNFRQPYSMDFLSFWAAGKLAASGQAASAYDFAAHHAVHLAAAPVETRLPFGYPPYFLFMLLPTGLLPYALAAPLWICATLVAYACAVRRLAPDFSAIALAFPPVIICAISGQNALLTAALFIAGMALLPSRSLLAGVLLGCLAIKPQLGLVIPFALLAGREHRAFAGALAAVCLLAFSSIAAFGLETWQAFFVQAQQMGRVATENLVGWQKMASIYAGLRLAGAPDALAWVFHVAGAVAGLGFVWQIWRRTDDALARAAILAPATLLVSPYLYVYDQAMLIVSLIWLASQRVHPILLGALFLLPLIQLLQFGSTASAFNVAPLLTISLLGLVRFQTSDATKRFRASAENSFSAV